MNTFEFEISSLRKSDDTLLNINDHKELMDYFRRSKIRNDLFSNKSNHTPMIKVKNIGFDKEKTTSTKKIIGTTFNQIEELEYKHKKNHSEFAFPSFTQTFHSFDEHEKKNTLFDKNKEKFSINTKILLYPNNRSNLQAKIEEQKSQQIKPYENLSSVRTIINMAQLKPVKLQKKKKNLIFFKNKVIQIENNELNNDSNKTQHLEKESLFHKIIRSGESPTNFFLTSKKKIAN